MRRKKAPALIKKYSNRRLYDTDESRYVTLEELAAKVKGGRDVQVLDAKTNEDLTQATLTQIIIEGRHAGRLLPIPLLFDLIRLEDEALTEFFSRYLSWALELYLGAKRGAQSLTPYNPFATLPFAASNALAKMLSGAAGWGQPPPMPNAPPYPPAPQEEEEEEDESEDEVRALRREIEELKTAILDRKGSAKSAATKSKTKKKPRRSQ